MSTPLELAREIVAAKNDYGPGMFILATALIEADEKR